MNQVTHRFVEQVPECLDGGVVYVSLRFATVIHKCCCGCGQEVVTPLSPSGWRLTFDGESVSLFPSIGNRSLPCQSHYWLENNQIRWLTWDAEEEDVDVIRRGQGAGSKGRQAPGDAGAVPLSAGPKAKRRRMWPWGNQK